MLSFVFVFNFSFAQSSRDARFTQIGHTTTIESEILNQTKKIYVHLPFDYNSDKEYALVVLLDNMAFKPLASVTENMAYEKAIPGCIVVCVDTPNKRQAYSPTFNDTSLLINGGKTIQYFEKELIPFLESKYKISSKILWGQGLSGMFSSFVMLTKPELFDGYFSDMPMLNLIDTTFNFDQAIKNINQKEVFYYLTGNTLVGSDKTTQRLLSTLECNQNAHLKWHYKMQKDSILITQVVNSYAYGLDWFFMDVRE